MLSTSDLAFIEKKGITAEMIDAQLKRFEVGFPFLKINAVATIGNGIKAFSPEETATCVKAWSDFQQTGKAIEKFVPASGAASRMFKNMFAFASSGKDAPTTDFEKEYFENITKFAFYADLNNACRKLYRSNVQELMSAGRYVDVVKAMLEPEGLNYGFLPKALLKFHKTTGGNAHTPLEEHLEEGAQYAADNNRKVNLHFTVSLVGQSGSGKTTLADLLPRFYDVEEGSISIDGVDIRDVSKYDLRALMGNVNQEAILFNDTIRNNITFGVESATDEEVIAAAKIANAYDFIMATENGFDTNIGDRGCNLSGGQRQRLSIARAILKNPPILILDEATSALDTESEHLVQQALDNLMHGRTTVVIAHRLSTIKNADLICVLQDGKIIEQGTHDQLIAENGSYKHLVDLQKF